MKLTKEQVKQMVGFMTYGQGAMLLAGGAVTHIEEAASGDRIDLNAIIKDGHVYNTEVSLLGTGEVKVFAYCGCKEFGLRGKCSHIAATLLKYCYTHVDGSPRREAGQIETSAAAKQLIAAYATPAVQKNTMHLVPVLSMAEAAPSVSFKIGSDKKYYVIKNLLQYASMADTGTTYAYGADLNFDHNAAAFDPRSRRLHDFILSHAMATRELINSRAHLRYAYGDALCIKEFGLSGSDFDMLFDMYLEDGRLQNRNPGGRFYLLTNDPKIDVDVQELGNGFKLTVTPLPRLVHGAEHEYAVLDTSIYRLSEEFAASMLPMLTAAQSTREPFLLSGSGAEEFCQTVVPKIREHTRNGVFDRLDDYMPGELYTAYNIDLPASDRLIATVKFSYDGREVDACSPEKRYEGLRRNSAAEQEALSALTQYFNPPEQPGLPYEITDEEKIYEFLKDGIQSLSRLGEVFVSDRLKGEQVVRPMQPALKLAVNGGVLKFSVDMGEFPKDELELLMRSVREKRKYYRLDDGRFMNLEGGELEGLEGVADGLGLDDGDLAKEELDLPLYKAMYLDNATKQDSSVKVERNAAFKKLVRDFKTVEDSDFELPNGLDKVLRNYQKTGFMWLRTLDAYRFGGILADDMGLGKTLQVLAYLQSIKDERPEDSTLPHTSLIICPASLVLNWSDEVLKWTPGLKTCLLVGVSKDRAQAIAHAEEFDLLITSYDSFRNDVKLHQLNSYYACILDEAQYIKNHQAQTFKAVKQVNALVRFALTGTPIENRLSELWSIFDFIMPEYLDSYEKFWCRFEKPIAVSQDKVSRATLAKLVTPFVLRRLKTEVLTELPPKTEMLCYIQMDEVQRKYYLAYAHDVKEKLAKAGKKDKIAIFAMLTRLRQLCCDPALWVENYPGESCKTEECLRMIDELMAGGHRVLLFSQFTTMLARIEDRLDKAGIASFTLKGETPLPERANLVRRFNAGEVPVFLISLKAGGTVLNLTGADTVIHFDPWWNVAAQNQATDRCYRIGQDKSVTVYKLIAKDTIEDNIIKLQNQKLELANIVSENADGGIMNMNEQELMELLNTSEEQD